MNLLGVSFLAQEKQLFSPGGKEMQVTEKQDMLTSYSSSSQDDTSGPILLNNILLLHLAVTWRLIDICYSFSPSYQYLGSMLVKELRGTESTQDACAKMRVKRIKTHLSSSS